MQNISCYNPHKHSSLGEVLNNFKKCKGALRLKGLGIAQLNCLGSDLCWGHQSWCHTCCWIHKSNAADRVLPEWKPPEAHRSLQSNSAHPAGTSGCVRSMILIQFTLEYSSLRLIALRNSALQAAASPKPCVLSSPLPFVKAIFLLSKYISSVMTFLACTSFCLSSGVYIQALDAFIISREHCTAQSTEVCNTLSPVLPLFLLPAFSEAGKPEQGLSEATEWSSAGVVLSRWTWASDALSTDLPAVTLATIGRERLSVTHTRPFLPPAPVPLGEAVGSLVVCVSALAWEVRAAAAPGGLLPFLSSFCPGSLALWLPEVILELFSPWLYHEGEMLV